MRVAYIAPYQGPALLKRRPILQNLALAGNLKIELIAELLMRRGHDVEILSQGEVVENSASYFAPFSETLGSQSLLTAHYASAIPIRFINGWWSGRRTLALFQRRHQVAPFDLVIIYNLKSAQAECALHAVRHLGLPLIVEYEDDVFVDIGGRPERSFVGRRNLSRIREVLESASGCIGVSPFVLSRFPDGIPSLLLRGVVSEEVMRAAVRPTSERQNRVVFSGTLFRSKGLEPLITAWKSARLAGWELHITGDGELSGRLREMAVGDNTIVFHGILDRSDTANLLGTARIAINPHDVSETPGNVFAFKIIEYLGSGAHVITTPMGQLEADLEQGVTYIPDNSPETIEAALRRVISGRLYERTAFQAAANRYGTVAVEEALDRLVREVQQRHGSCGIKRPRRKGARETATPASSITAKES